jgi:hypothetical protein
MDANPVVLTNGPWDQEKRWWPGKTSPESTGWRWTAMSCDISGWMRRRFHPSPPATRRGGRAWHGDDLSGREAFAMVGNHTRRSPGTPGTDPASAAARRRHRLVPAAKGAPGVAPAEPDQARVDGPASGHVEAGIRGDLLGGESQGHSACPGDAPLPRLHGNERSYGRILPRVRRLLIMLSPPGRTPPRRRRRTDNHGSRWTCHPARPWAPPSILQGPVVPSPPPGLRRSRIGVISAEGSSRCRKWNRTVWQLTDSEIPDPT